MTDKEIAEEYVDTLLNKDDSELDKFLDENLGDLKLTKKQAGALLGIIKGIGISSFLAGLKTGRLIWHDLRKDPNDVPFQEKNEKWHIVLDNFGNKCFYDNIINKWRRLETLDIIEPTAWCEVPKYTEE